VVVWDLAPTILCLGLGMSVAKSHWTAAAGGFRELASPKLRLERIDVISVDRSPILVARGGIAAFQMSELNRCQVSEQCYYGARLTIGKAD